MCGVVAAFTRNESRKIWLENGHLEQVKGGAMKRYGPVIFVLLLAALLGSACLPAPTLEMLSTPTVGAVSGPVGIGTICTHSGERAEVQGILRLPDAVSCTRDGNPNQCTVQLYDPYDDKTLPVSLYVSASGVSPNQMAALTKNFGYADFKVATASGELVGHGARVSLLGKVGASSQGSGSGSVVGCTLSDVKQVTALKQLTPVGMEVLKVGLAEAVANGDVLASVNGKGLEQLNLKLKSQAKNNLEIDIPAGTMFESLMGGVQNMIVRRGALAVLKPGSELLLPLEVACANMEKSQPASGDMFKVGKSPVSADLLKLLNLSDFHFASNRVQQFAVWTLTDNPPVGYFVGISTNSGQTGGPSAAEITEMRRLFTAAGIDLVPFKVFQ
jgi:hypothetical protein